MLCVDLIDIFKIHVNFILIIFLIFPFNYSFTYKLMQEHSFNNISKHDLHNAIRKIVRSDNLSDLTAGGVRKKLSEHFKTPKEYMDTRAQEVSSLINEVLREIAITSDQSHDNNTNTDETEGELSRKLVDTDKFPDLHSKHSKDPLKVNTSVNYNSPTKHISTTKHDNNTMKHEMKKDEKVNYVELKSESPVKREYEENIQSDITTESLEPPRRVSRLQRDLMTKDFFLNNAKSIEIKLQESDPIFALPRLFSTGSCGWNCNGKIKLKVGDHEVYCQVGFNCTVVGSKNWSD